MLTFRPRSSYEKNLVLLVRAFETLLRRLDIEDTARPKMVFVGDGPARIQVEEMCRAAGIDAVFEGYLSGEHLAEAYASADIFALVPL